VAVAAVHKTIIYYYSRSTNHIKKHLPYKQGARVLPRKLKFTLQAVYNVVLRFEEFQKKTEMMIFVAARHPPPTRQQRRPLTLERVTLSCPRLASRPAVAAHRQVKAAAATRARSGCGNGPCQI
jgi:hypothetical protein